MNCLLNFTNNAFWHFMLCRNLLSSVKIAHMLYAYKYGRLWKLDSDVTSEIARDCIESKWRPPVIAKIASFGVLNRLYFSF